MKSITSLIKSRLWAILFLIALILINFAFAQGESIQDVSEFNIMLLLPLILGILAHWVKSYSRQQAPNLMEYLKASLSNTFTTIIGAISSLIGLVAASPANYAPINFVVLFNVFLLGFGWDSATGGTSWRNGTVVNKPE